MPPKTHTPHIDYTSNTNLPTSQKGRDTSETIFYYLNMPTILVLIAAQRDGFRSKQAFKEQQYFQIKFEHTHYFQMSNTAAVFSIQS